MLVPSIEPLNQAYWKCEAKARPPAFRYVSRFAGFALYVSSPSQERRTMSKGIR